MATAVSNRAAKASIHAIVGATGSGKTTTVFNDINREKPKRLLIWDKKGEFARDGYAVPVHSLAEVAHMLIAAGPRGGFKIAYQPRGGSEKLKRDFSLFCRMAFQAKNLWLIAEEMSDYTMAGWSPDGWKEVVTQGRTEGLTIYGLTQSPALCDKTFFTNCSSIQSGRLNQRSHAKVMADSLDCKPEDILRLTDGEFIKITFSPRTIQRGKVF